MSDNKEIIYLEPDEEITSIIDKIKSFKDIDNIFLVAPKNAVITQSVVNLKILKKEAKKLKKSIAFVTGDSIGRNLAAQVGIDVYESINDESPLRTPEQIQPNLNETIEVDMTEKTQPQPPKNLKVNYYNNSDESDKKSDLPTHSSKTPISAKSYSEPVVSKPKKPKKMIIKVIIIVAILGLSALWLFYFHPKSTIDLEVKATSITEEIVMKVDTSLKKANSAEKAIPGEILSTDHELTKSFSATGSKNVGEKASGTITLSNGTGTVVNVPAATQVQSKSGLYFLTTEPVTVPAATASVDSEGNVVKTSGKADVLVQASESGDNYNIGPTTFSVVNFPALSGENHANISGGTSKKVTIISQDDLDKAKSELDKELKGIIKENLQKEAHAKELTYLVDAINYHDEHFSTNQQAGTETDNFSASFKLYAKTIAFDEADYKENLIVALGDKIPHEKELILSKEDEVTQGSFEADYAKGILQIDGTIKTKIAHKIDTDHLKNTMRGKSFAVAKSHILEDPEILSADIENNLSWYKKISARVKNIVINKNYIVK